MLTVFGAINVDQVIRVPAIARPGETVLGRLEAVTFGGKGANQAVAAARVLAGRMPVAIVGAVGRDAQGDAVLENFVANGVQIHLVDRIAAPTGSAIITLDDAGENAITLVAGANGAVDPRAIDATTLENTEVLLCQGEIDIAASCALLLDYKERRPHGLAIVNLAPVPLSLKEVCHALLASADILVVNAHEAKSLCHSIGNGEESDGLLAAIARDTETTIIVTLGGDGAIARCPDGTFIPAATPEVEIVDTTGAGDTFVGSLAALLAEGEDLGVALEVACRAGALSCTRLGAQGGMPDRAQLFELVTA